MLGGPHLEQLQQMLHQRTEIVSSLTCIDLFNNCIGSAMFRILDLYIVPDDNPFLACSYKQPEHDKNAKPASLSLMAHQGFVFADMLQNGDPVGPCVNAHLQDH